MKRKAKQGIKTKAQKSQKHNFKDTRKLPGLLGRIITGVLDVIKSGSAYLVSEQVAEDVFIKREDLGNALDGDKVRVKIVAITKGGKPEGEVITVLQRSQQEFIGVLEASENYGFVVPENKKISFDIFLPGHELKKAKDGDKVLVRVTDWNDGNKNPTGTIVENLNNERANQVAMKEILVERGFQLHFSPEAEQELAKMSKTIDPKEIANRKDCRDILTFTIDPKDAKDFDDALSIRLLKNGYYEVGVHIADVSYYIAPDTALDKDAYANATSVYLPDRVLPMFPETISNGLCSLRPQEEKLTFSVLFQINEQGKIKQHWIGRTAIFSDRRYTYEEVQEVIEGKDDTYKKEIFILNQMAQSLRQERFENGAINFSSQEIRYQLDEEGKPIGIEIKESKQAHQLIEEFMLLANRYVAHFVSKKNFNGQVVPFPYRVHPLPDEMKLAQFAAFAARFGYQLNLKNHEEIAHSFNEMLEQVSGKPEEHLLQQLGIRTMSKALYTTDNDGHYGLGFEDYCHFTSPIRRYPDVMVHRIVQEILEGRIHIDKGMEQKCKHCSEQEKKAMDAERKANKYKQVEYMQQFVGESLEAIVSGVSHTGFWAETIAQKCEGMVSITELTHLDYFDFVEAEYALVGQQSGLRFRIGDKVKVRVERADLDSKTIDFGFIDRISNETIKSIKQKRQQKQSKQ